MATTGINNGTLVALYLDGLKINHLTTNDFSIEQSLRDATTKDSVGWEDVLEGLRSSTFSCEGYFAEDATIGADEIIADLVTTRGTVVVRMSSEVVGDKFYEGTCFITSFSMGAPTEESQTFSLEVKVTGALTVGTVST